jgi:hypothetical protein
MEVCDIRCNQLTLFVLMAIVFTNCNKRTTYQYFCYIMAVSFIGRENHRPVPSHTSCIEYTSLEQELELTSQWR